jgi:tetratricopeptide (TPR) repeat protein
MKPEKKKIIKSKTSPISADFKINQPKMIFWFAIGIILILTFFLYSKSFRFDFLTLDDKPYITDNPNVHEFTFASLGRIFTSFSNGNYHPLTTIIWALCYSLSPAKPAIFHAVNIVFHLSNVILVFVFFNRLLTKKFAAIFVAGIFAVHPLNIESVVWISELKTILFSFFFLLALISYHSYISKGYKKKYFFGVIFFFVFSLLSKSAAVVFPLVLFAIDYYCGRKISKNSVIEKMPLLLLSAGFGILALFSQQVGVDNEMQVHFNFGSRILFAFYNLGFYIYRLVIPGNLSIYHFLPSPDNALPLIYFLAVPLTLIPAAALLLYKKYRKTVVFGLLFYFINLLLILQFIPVGVAVVAERYAYLPMLGVLFIVGHVLEERAHALFRNRVPQLLLSAILILAISILSVISAKRIKVWENQVVLFTDMANKYPDYAHSTRMVADAKYFAGDFDAARKDYILCNEKKPQAVVFFNIGTISYKSGKYQEAIVEISQAIEMDSTQAEFFYNRGLCYMELEKFSNAIKDFSSACSLLPGYTDAIINNAYCYFMNGKYTQAIALYCLADYYSPKHPAIPFSLGIVYNTLGMHDEACENYRKSAERGFQPAREKMASECSR